MGTQKNQQNLPSKYLHNFQKDQEIYKGLKLVKYTNCKKMPNNLKPMLNHVHVCSTHSNSFQNLKFDEYKTIWNKCNWANRVRNGIIETIFTTWPSKQTLYKHPIESRWWMFIGIDKVRNIQKKFIQTQRLICKFINDPVPQLTKQVRDQKKSISDQRGLNTQGWCPRLSLFLHHSANYFCPPRACLLPPPTNIVCLAWQELWHWIQLLEVLPY